MDETEYFILFHDDTGTWFAAPPGFRDLVLDLTGFGDTAWDAIDDLLCHPKFQKGVISGKWPMPAASDFVEVSQPDGAKIAEVTYEPCIASNLRAALRRQSFRVISGG